MDNSEYKQPMRWAVVGGGMMGLALAHRLQQQGQNVTLLESAPQLGGLASVWEINGLTWDRHYHVISMTDTTLLTVLKELDLEKQINWVETKTGFFTDGQLYSMSNAVQFLQFPPLNLIDKVRLATTIMYASKVKNWRRLEKITAAKWLKRWSGKKVFEKIWLPLLRAKMGDNYEISSAAMIWATIQRMYKARRTGLKKELFGYVPGGYEKILHRFAESLEDRDVDIQVNARLTNIRPLECGQVECAFADDSTEQFDRVVMTTPSSVVPKVCKDLSDNEIAQYSGIQYQGIICASMLLKNPISDYYVTNITDTSIPLTGIIEMSALVDRQEFGGSHLVYLPKYVPSDDAIFDMTDEEIQEEFVSSVERMYSSFDRNDIEAFKISRVRSVMAIPTLNYSERLPPMKTSIPGLFVVNSAHILRGNLNVNETIQIAEDAMNEFFLPLIESAEIPMHTRHRDDTEKQLVS